MPRTRSTPATDSLFIAEAEVARRLGKDPVAWSGIAVVLEREGLPRVDPLFGGRYWPAVQAFFHRRYGLLNLSAAGQIVPDGQENFDAL